MPPLPSESDLDLDPDLGTPDCRRPPSDIGGLLLREMRTMRAEVKQVRDVLMVATPERSSVLDVLRKHSAQIEDVKAWQEKHERTHEPSSPGGVEKILAAIGDGAARAIGTGLIAVLAWGAYYLLVRGGRP